MKSIKCSNRNIHCRSFNLQIFKQINALTLNSINSVSMYDTLMEVIWIYDRQKRNGKRWSQITFLLINWFYENQCMQCIDNNKGRFILTITYQSLHAAKIIR